MLLDLFITHYNEPWEVGEPGLAMLAHQRCVDWSKIRVTIVHDGTQPFAAELFKDYPFEVRQESIPHRGIAGARNWCIEHSDAEWIKWNDFDDLFISAYALRSLTDALDHAEAYDFLWFDVYAEYKGLRYLKSDRDPVVLHGKIFRRDFLNEHNLRFKEDLTWCEDSAFLSVLEMEIDTRRIGKIKTDAPIYAWVHRIGSLCNRPEIRFDNLKSFFRRHCYVAEEFRKRGFMDEYHTMVARTICDSYYTLRIAGLTEDTSEHERQVWEYFKAHKAEFLKCRNKAFDQVVEATNRENDTDRVRKQDVLDWVKSLRQKYEDGEKNV